MDHLEEQTSLCVSAACLSLNQRTGFGGMTRAVFISVMRAVAVEDESQLGHDQRIYVTPFSLPSPPVFSFSPVSPLAEPVPPVTPVKPKFISYETVLYRRPGLTTCPSCQLQVTTQVTYRTGTLAWAVCFTMVLFGLVLGCCLIPLLVDYFKDAYHTCPRCRRVLYVHKRGCCE